MELNRTTGEVAVLAKETDKEGVVVREYDDTSDGYGLIATSTAR